MQKKALILLSLAIASFSLTGCFGSKSASAQKEANLLGIVKVEQEAYTSTSANTFPISSDEVVSRKNFSGDKVTLLWGLVTLKDY